MCQIWQFSVLAVSFDDNTDEESYYIQVQAYSEDLRRLLQLCNDGGTALARIPIDTTKYLKHWLDSACDTSQTDSTHSDTTTQVGVFGISYNDRPDSDTSAQAGVYAVPSVYIDVAIGWCIMAHILNASIIPRSE